MKHSFYLKEPQAEKGSKPSLILFTCHFNKEKKKFVYSTGERIAPIGWSFENRAPKLRGSNRLKEASSIKQQLDRYSNKFEELIGVYSRIN
ncbi:hypothetical protein [Winogradskyella helgolandensis]|uniref:hypothetical protein n=1 Tax=Winogradskyella helgolandensis TaxID=2697010 RepID=UPI0015CDEB75|nr:hypothetical protein [Winogradskyella helgolandensis]